MDSKFKYIAVCLGGFGDLVATEIKEALTNSGDESAIVSKISSDNGYKCFPESYVLMDGSPVPQGQSGCDRVIVETNCSLSVLWSVRTVQYWFSCIFHSDELPMSGNDQVTEFLVNNMTKDSITQAVLGAKEYFQQKGVIVNQDNVETPKLLKFCGRCVRDGGHSYNGQLISQSIGQAVLSHFNWSVDLTTMDCEIVAIAFNRDIFVGINISQGKPFVKNRFPAERQGLMTGESKANAIYSSMRPSTANIIARLLRPEKGDIVIEALAGPAVFLQEVSRDCGITLIGGDIESSLVSDWQVIKASNITPFVHEIQYALWSVSKLPVRNGSVDVILVDYPWGRGSKAIPVHYRAKLPKMVEEMARVLRPGFGRGLFIVQNFQHLRSCLDSVYFRNIKATAVNIGGLVCSFVYFQRSDAVFVRPVKGTDTWDANDELTNNANDVSTTRKQTCEQRSERNAKKARSENQVE